jgi:hypothetical protein
MRPDLDARRNNFGTLQIEFIWKSIKRVISRNFVHDIDHMRSLIRDLFLANASKLSFAGYWIERFLGGADWFKNIGS